MPCSQDLNYTHTYLSVCIYYDQFSNFLPELKATFIYYLYYHILPTGVQSTICLFNPYLYEVTIVLHVMLDFTENLHEEQQFLTLGQTLNLFPKCENASILPNVLIFIFLHRFLWNCLCWNTKPHLDEGYLAAMKKRKRRFPPIEVISLRKMSILRNICMKERPFLTVKVEIINYSTKHKLYISQYSSLSHI